MADLFKDKYRITSARLPGWDYAAVAYYFVTICTHERIHYFGDVLRDDNGEWSAALSGIGVIVRDCWLAIPKHFSNARLDAWVIMPNHAHGIIEIRDSSHDKIVETLHVETLHATSLQWKNDDFYSTISPKPGSLSTIVRSFKSAATNQCHKQNLDFHWQTRFYDHIIRNEISLNKIRWYIGRNPKMWPHDRNNQEGLLL